jgi:hypothetical protein
MRENFMYGLTRGSGEIDTVEVGGTGQGESIQTTEIPS